MWMKVLLSNLSSLVLLKCLEDNFGIRKDVDSNLTFLEVENINKKEK